MAWKVGAFVLAGLVLAGIMVIRFSKGTGLSSTYNLNLKARNAGGIIIGAGVLMAGVPVGRVSEIFLAPDGSSVTMVASIYERFRISSNAVFGIETVGFLGDRYISVSPGPQSGEEEAGFLEPGDTVVVQAPFDFAEVAESATGLMERLSSTVGQLSNSVERLNATILSAESLEDLTVTISNFRGLSERALSAVARVDTFVLTNTPGLSQSIENFEQFTEELQVVTEELQGTLATNRVGITSMVKNMEKATAKLNEILAGLEQGKGLAGNLLKDEELAQYSSLMVSNFMVLSSNLNNVGLWRVLRGPSD